MRTIPLKRGELLAILATAKNQSGTVINLSDGYSVASDAIGNGGRFDLAPTINGQGKLEINFDTYDMAAGKYQLDIRITKNSDQFTDRLALVIIEPITPPTPR